MYDFFRKIPLFQDLPREDLERLCELVEEVQLPAGSELFSEGSKGDRAYIIRDGEIEIYKNSAGREVLLAVRKSGEVIGEISLLESSPRLATGRARVDSQLIAISQEQFDHLLDTSPSAARAILHTVTQRLRSTELSLRQSEKLAQLGTLTAGIAHEINNPASAAQRGASQLQDAVSRLQRDHLALSRFELDDAQREKLLELDAQARRCANEPVTLSSLERGDREEALEDWLDGQHLENTWKLAPMLVNLGFQQDQLEEMAQHFTPKQFITVVHWLDSSFTIYALLAEITVGAGRIGEIVRALKSYVYLDQAPVQPVDVHEGLDNTLVILRNKLKHGVTVHREYEHDLPKIYGYGSELNQVWTNIIDNAIDAMDGQGEITLRTHHDNEWVIVEIEDMGPGIPSEIQTKIFNPFFTTKPVGKGTGLGLNISYNIIHKHGGEIKLTSNPGKTCFQVRLPLNFEAVSSNGPQSVEND